MLNPNLQAKKAAMASESQSATSIEALLSGSPQSRGRLIDELWNEETSIPGALDPFANAGMGGRFDLLQTMRILAMSTNRDPELASRLISTASLSRELDLPTLHTSAAAALCRPETMRWVSRNAAHVASTPNWRMVLPGLGGAIVSVPLAEEALMNLVGAKADLPKELTRYVQLNPWFSKRFAIRFRRYTGGKRFRIHDRAATARAWAHARTLLGDHVPARWRSPHGRGAQRPLDDWSYRLLVRYAALVESGYRKEGISPTMAPLFAIASAADAKKLPSRDALSTWRALPANLEQTALNMIGLGSSPAPEINVASPQASSAIGAIKFHRGMNPKIRWQ